VIRAENKWYQAGAYAVPNWFQLDDGGILLHLPLKKTIFAVIMPAGAASMGVTKSLEGAYVLRTRPSRGRPLRNRAAAQEQWMVRLRSRSSREVKAAGVPVLTAGNNRTDQAFCGDAGRACASKSYVVN
jgi:hypothetical protein